jgi:pyridoxine 5-phosphate synthase
VRPDVVTLVPEKREERTTEGGLDVRSPATRRACEWLARAGIPTSLFIDPTEEAVRGSHALGVPRVELHTGDYCQAWQPVAHARADEELHRLARAARLGGELGLHVAAGHGLDYANVGAVCAIPEIVELNIGHAIVARAVLVGMERAVGEMTHAMRRGRKQEK